MAVACFAAATAAVHAQTGWKPEKNVEIIVGTAAGSSPDKVARLIQKLWQDRNVLDVPTVIVNKPGGNNSIGWTYLNQHSGNGHYLMIGVVNLSLAYLTGVTRLSYRDVTPVSMLFHEYTALVVRSDAPYKSPADIIQILKKDPNAVSLGVSTAAGGSNHLAAAMALSGAGVDVKKVRTVVFNAGGSSVTALLGGHVDMIALSPSVVISHLNAGRLRAIATVAPNRLSGVYADVPTFRELGVKPYLSKYRAIIGPRDMNPEQIAYWEGRFNRLSGDSEWKKILDENGWEGQFMNSRDLEAFMDETHKEVEKALGELGMLKKQ